MKRLFLLDAYALIFRSYYAFIKNPRITSKGLNTSAIFGFLLTLEEVLNKQHPTHMAVVFDTHEPTFRHIMYKEYKANRAETPEDILKAVPYIKKLLEAFRIPVIACPGYEADDVIGTLSRLASQKDFETYMMTPDKDYAQLVKENVYMFKPSRSGNDSVLWGVEDVKREFDVANHLQVIDILALMGDKVDNIPGAPGIGPKTASKLISEYGNVENIIANADKLKDKLQQTIKDNKDNIILSKTLATIEINVPIAFDEEDLQMCEPNYPALKALYEELEFRTFIAKLNANDAVAQISQKKKEPVAPATDVIQTSLFQEEGQADLFSQPTFNTIANTNHSYLLASSDEEIHNLVNTISGLKEFCFDTETTSISAIDAELVAISFSWKKNEGYLIRFDNDKQRTLRILEVVRPIFENKNIRKIGQNMKYDIQVLANYGIKVKGPLFDTMIAHYLLEPDNRHNMDLLSETYLNYTPIHIEELIGEKRQGQKNMRDIDTDRIKEYAVEDADVTFQLKEVFEPMLKEKELYPLFTDIEMPLVPVLAKMERNGVVLDTESLKSVAEEMRQEIISLEQDIYSIAGEEFNISSPRQLGDILFDKMKLDEKAKKTKTNQYFTNEEVLQHLKNKSPIVEKVLDYRGLKKLLSTYVEALPSLINPRTGRIHTSFNQAVAATGRLSSNSPNLQNIPIREERGRFLRKAFVPAKGCKLISVDYSQIELRLMAHLSNDEAMVADFNSGQDIHSATAAKINGVPISEVTKDMRSKAKTANFGIIYGISAFGLAERLNIGRSEAKELIDGYFRTYPGVKTYMDKSVQQARATGFVTTMFGRRRYLPDIQSRNQVARGIAERNAINAPIQGSAADIIKIAMIRIQNVLEEQKLKTKMILQVHDELIFETPEDEVDTVSKMVVSEMSNATKLHVPLIAECGIGDNWLEAH